MNACVRVHSYWIFNLRRFLIRVQVISVKSYRCLLGVINSCRVIEYFVLRVEDPVRISVLDPSVAATVSVTPGKDYYFFFFFNVLNCT